jgi:S-adenosylmethionine synthetase
MADHQIYTSESVSEGHPDKLADQISDALLDEALSQDKGARVAIETLVTHGLALIAGELTMDGYIDIPTIVRSTITDVGYTHTDIGLDGRACAVITAVHEQSPDIAQGVDTGGAGDQGMMFGMASNETPELMPLPISLAHALTHRAAFIKRSRPSVGFLPDAKSQVSVRYENGVPKSIDTIVLSVQHKPTMSQAVVHERAHEHVIQPVLKQYEQYLGGEIKYHINPTGIFVRGGPDADTGLTGRKIIVDTYGGLCPHGGGAFSGKDPTKVDRSAAYIARQAAKCVVAAGLADKCVLGLAYAIGVPDPVSINIETYGTENVAPEKITAAVREVFDLTPKGIIDSINLTNGHFGNEAFPWESTAPAADLKQAAGA